MNGGGKKGLEPIKKATNRKQDGQRSAQHPKSLTLTVEHSQQLRKRTAIRRNPAQPNQPTSLRSFPSPHPGQQKGHSRATVPLDLDSKTQKSSVSSVMNLFSRFKNKIGGGQQKGKASTSKSTKEMEGKDDKDDLQRRLAIQFDRKKLTQRQDLSGPSSSLPSDTYGASSIDNQEGRGYQEQVFESLADIRRKLRQQQQSGKRGRRALLPPSSSQRHQGQYVQPTRGPTGDRRGAFRRPPSGQTEDKPPPLPPKRSSSQQTASIQQPPSGRLQPPRLPSPRREAPRLPSRRLEPPRLEPPRFEPPRLPPPRIKPRGPLPSLPKVDLLKLASTQDLNKAYMTTAQELRTFYGHEFTPVSSQLKQFMKRQTDKKRIYNHRRRATSQLQSQSVQPAPQWKKLTEPEVNQLISVRTKFPSWPSILQEKLNQFQLPQGRRAKHTIFQNQGSLSDHNENIRFYRQCMQTLLGNQGASAPLTPHEQMLLFDSLETFLLRLPPKLFAKLQSQQQWPLDPATVLKQFKAKSSNSLELSVGVEDLIPAVQSLVTLIEQIERQDKVFQKQMDEKKMSELMVALGQKNVARISNLMGIDLEKYITSRRKTMFGRCFTKEYMIRASEMERMKAYQEIQSTVQWTQANYFINQLEKLPSLTKMEDKISTYCIIANILSQMPAETYQYLLSVPDIDVPQIHATALKVQIKCLTSQLRRATNEDEVAAALTKITKTFKAQQTAISLLTRFRQSNRIDRKLIEQQSELQKLVSQGSPPLLDMLKELTPIFRDIFSTENMANLRNTDYWKTLLSFQSAHDKTNREVSQLYPWKLLKKSNLLSSILESLKLYTLPSDPSLQRTHLQKRTVVFTHFLSNLIKFHQSEAASPFERQLVRRIIAQVINPKNLYGNQLSHTLHNVWNSIFGFDKLRQIHIWAANPGYEVTKVAKKIVTNDFPIPLSEDQLKTVQKVALLSHLELNFHNNKGISEEQKLWKTHQFIKAFDYHHQNGLILGKLLNLPNVKISQEGLEIQLLGRLPVALTNPTYIEMNTLTQKISNLDPKGRNSVKMFSKYFISVEDSVKRLAVQNPVFLKQCEIFLHISKPQKVQEILSECTHLSEKAQGFLVEVENFISMEPPLSEQQKSLLASWLQLQGSFIKQMERKSPNQLEWTTIYNRVQQFLKNNMNNLDKSTVKSMKTEAQTISDLWKSTKLIRHVSIPMPKYRESQLAQRQSLLPSKIQLQTSPRSHFIVSSMVKDEAFMKMKQRVLKLPNQFNSLKKELQDLAYAAKTPFSHSMLTMITHTILLKHFLDGYQKSYVHQNSGLISQKLLQLKTVRTHYKSLIEKQLKTIESSIISPYFFKMLNIEPNWTFNLLTAMSSGQSISELIPKQINIILKGKDYLGMPDDPSRAYNFLASLSEVEPEARMKIIQSLGMSHDKLIVEAVSCIKMARFKGMKAIDLSSSLQTLPLGLSKLITCQDTQTMKLALAEIDKYIKNDAQNLNSPLTKAALRMIQSELGQVIQRRQPFQAQRAKALTLLVYSLLPRLHMSGVPYFIKVFVETLSVQDRLLLEMTTGLSLNRMKRWNSQLGRYQMTAGEKVRLNIFAKMLHSDSATLKPLKEQTQLIPEWNFNPHGFDEDQAYGPVSVQRLLLRFIALFGEKIDQYKGFKSSKTKQNLRFPPFKTKLHLIRGINSQQPIRKINSQNPIYAQLDFNKQQANEGRRQGLRLQRPSVSVPQPSTSQDDSVIYSTISQFRQGNP